MEFILVGRCREGMNRFGVLIMRLIAFVIIVSGLSMGAPAPKAGTNSIEWSQFRGPNGSGVVSDFRPPVQIPADRPSWETPLPAGKSSPVLWGDKIFVTGLEAGRLVTIALDSRSGKLLWKQEAPEVPLENVHSANSVAASTPCVDADSVIVYFGSYGLIGYDHFGRELWKRAIPTPRTMYGVATSPILEGPRVILVLDDDANLEGSPLSGSKVIALDKATGEPVWQTPRPYNRGTWSTPAIWTHEMGTDLVVVGNGRVYGYDAATGREKWYVNGFSREPIAVPVVGDGRLYVSVAMQGGRGDEELDPRPFWDAMLHFDTDGDGRIGRDEITESFTFPLRPELPPGHPGFGIPLPGDPVKRKARQNEFFGWRDKNKDDYWTREEFMSDMSVGRGQPNLVAIRPGGSGDITETHVAWNLHSGVPEIPSPVFHAGRLYLVRDGGLLSCVRTDTGRVVYRERLGAPGQYSASPVIANGNVYAVSSGGVLTVVKTGDEFTILHQADLGAAVHGTPAIDRDTFYVRTVDALRAFRRD
jgi:outer membrane protein assembly factor BamB